MENWIPSRILVCGRPLMDFRHMLTQELKHAVGQTEGFLLEPLRHLGDMLDGRVVHVIILGVPLLLLN